MEVFRKTIPDNEKYSTDDYKRIFYALTYTFMSDVCYKELDKFFQSFKFYDNDKFKNELENFKAVLNYQFDCFTKFYMELDRLDE